MVNRKTITIELTKIETDLILAGLACAHNCYDDENFRNLYKDLKRGFDSLEELEKKDSK